ncbi:uncharacterized protein [Coffea arabica]|uniref:RNase H type-1 domain-containing protein n=1 Tax=Coffea arabica TaxID=13443 RepID=A0ABM4WMX4_COFAR
MSSLVATWQPQSGGLPKRQLNLVLAPMDDVPMKLQSWWMHSFGNSTLAALTRLLPPFICWELWKARNKACFEDVVATSTSLLQQITMQLHTGLVLLLVYPSKRRAIALSWSYPIRPYVKLNIDGSSLGNPGDSGGGGLIRDDSRRFLCGFSSYYRWHTNTHAEASALLEGIQLYLLPGYAHAMVELDSLTLLNVVQGWSKFP